MTRFWEGGFLGVLGSKKISESKGRQRMGGGFSRGTVRESCWRSGVIFWILERKLEEDFSGEGLF